MESPSRILDLGQPSTMAEQAAVMRAVHQLLDQEPKIFSDPLTLRILGTDAERWLRKNLEMFRPAYMSPARVLAVIRSRYAEDELLAAVERGTGQYVVLGAGLDTFAYRTPHLSTRLEVFEVDHPATQEWKRARLGETGIEIPGNLHFVPVDFQTSSLAERLAASGFDRRAPAFFSWLGVTYYLTREAIFDTLKFVATQGVASQVVFDFAMEDSALNPKTRAEVGQLMAKLAQRGEPWLTRFDPTVLADDLLRSGFRGTFYLSERIATERYLSGRADNLQISGGLQIMSAYR